MRFKAGSVHNEHFKPLAEGTAEIHKKLADSKTSKNELKRLSKHLAKPIRAATIR